MSDELKQFIGDLAGNRKLRVAFILGKHGAEFKSQDEMQACVNELVQDLAFISHVPIGGGT